MKAQHFPRVREAIRFLIIAGLDVCLLPAGRLLATHIPYSSGNVLAGVGAGQIKHFSPTGTLLETLNNTTGSSEQTGMCFDAMGNLYSTNFSANSMSKFNTMGGLLLANFGSGFSADPESCAFDAANNVYVGQADGLRRIRKFDSSGTFLTEFSPATEARGTDHIDLAADQCTMFYTSEGNLMKRYNVCASTQLPDFASGLTGPCYAHRLRPNGEVLVACTTRVLRLSPTGTLMQTYLGSTYGESDTLFALNLDPDGATFWTAGLSVGNIRRINITTGTQVNTFNGGILGGSLAGLAIAGEIVVSQPTPTPTQPAVTPTPTFAPGSIAVPTLSFPLLGVLAMALVAAAIILMRRS